jgi:hypothetical protein
VVQNARSGFARTIRSESPIIPIPINKLMLAPLAGTDMFENRINGLVPNVGMPSFNTTLLATPRSSATQVTPMAVQIADIYKAAVNRAIEDHEIDKLFNAEFYDFQI